MALNPEPTKKSRAISPAATVTSASCDHCSDWDRVFDDDDPPPNKRVLMLPDSYI